ncbi:MAG: hypothetical protein ABIB43_05885 [archaeon]
MRKPFKHLLVGAVATEINKVDLRASKKASDNRVSLDFVVQWISAEDFGLKERGIIPQIYKHSPDIFGEVGITTLSEPIYPVDYNGLLKAQSHAHQYLSNVYDLPEDMVIEEPPVYPVKEIKNHVIYRIPRYRFDSKEILFAELKSTKDCIKDKF